MSPKRYFARLFSPRPSLPTLTTPPSRPAKDPFIQIVVGRPASESSSDAPRSWYLKRSLLSQHTIFFATACRGPWKEGQENRIVLPKDDALVFADFVDFMRSNIYSLNVMRREYDSVHSHAAAWVLGDKLGCLPYCNAALRKLHTHLTSHSLNPFTTLSTSPIRPTDIEYICVSTPPFPEFITPSTTTTVTPLPLLPLKTSSSFPAKPRSSSSTALRRLFFDAAASHWTRGDILLVSSPDTMDICTSPATVVAELTWKDIWAAHEDFRTVMLGSLAWPDASRNLCLRSVDEYLPRPLPTPNSPSTVAAIDSDADDSGGEWDAGTKKGEDGGGGEEGARGKRRGRTLKKKMVSLPLRTPERKRVKREQENILPAKPKEDILLDEPKEGAGGIGGRHDAEGQTSEG
ncbi:hypothetical protein BCR34DRAFT_615205 [Clohesyomyces aquaticus]|uniref:BTB domain-containing protein n=1 Tax=Clohesyomyces aquaticus TaxID=1231657 RepID=A0A1Y1ZJF2_9PLEO|nr:hypothetical protein BCR34DRAFT_615205 [Clohesyomyces aquaticus]